MTWSVIGKFRFYDFAMNLCWCFSVCWHVCCVLTVAGQDDEAGAGKPWHVAHPLHRWQCTASLRSHQSLGVCNSHQACSCTSQGRAGTEQHKWSWPREMIGGRSRGHHELLLEAPSLCVPSEVTDRSQKKTCLLNSHSIYI